MTDVRTPERELQLGWLDALARHRRPLYALVALVHLASFNGIWRVGVDSALYRGLARSLARGDGYTFAGEHHQHAFPGMPWMLAGLNKLFGETPVPGLVMLTLMALATLWLIDRLIATRHPQWVATIVTLGVGLNFRFVRQAQELMTDIPFALGVMATLYGLERLRRMDADDRRELVRSTLYLLGGLALAAITRPTFGVLAGAIVVASVVRAVRNRDGRRWLHLAILGAALLAAFGLFLTDPRTTGFSPLQGVYEQELMVRVRELPQTFRAQLDKFLGSNLNDAFYSQYMNPLSLPAAVLVLAGGALVVRRNLVWGLMIFGLVAVTLPLSTVPRYYIMVMPMLWLGWVLLWSHVTVRVPAGLRGPVLLVALATPLAMNVGRVAGFVIDQRRPDVAWLRDGADRQTTFYADYRNGIVLGQRRIGAMIAAHATPQQRVVGPAAHVLAYFADRGVFGERALVERNAAITQLPATLAKARPDLAIFPTSAYADDDGLIRDLIRKRVLVAERELASVPNGDADDVRLATVSVRVPPAGQNWRTYRPTTEPSAKKLAALRKAAKLERAETLARRERKLERERRQAKLERAARLERRAKIEARLERQAKLERREKNDRKERRERRERQKRKAAKLAATSAPATTAPATRPATAPTTRPATAPTTRPA